MRLDASALRALNLTEPPGNAVSTSPLVVVSLFLIYLLRVPQVQLEIPLY